MSCCANGAREHKAALVVASEDSEAARGTDVLMSIGGGDLVRIGDEPANVVPFPPRHAPRRPGGLERSGS